MSVRRSSALWAGGALAFAGGAAAAFFLAPLGGEFAPAAAPLPGCPGDFFTQSARVFDAVQICATRAVPADKLHHAAHVTAQWIDNDADGVADLPELPAQLRARGATLLMSGTGFSARAFVRLAPALDGIVGQDLSADETAPAPPRRDAAQEEIHHLILTAGWAQLFPDALSDQAGSLAYAQWQEAESRALYAYDDPTCDSSCKVTEFIYLSFAAYLGAAADLESDELRVHTRTALRARLPGVVALIEAPGHHLPRHAWPDGTYAHPRHISSSQAQT